MLPVESLYMCRLFSCVRCGRYLVVEPCEMWESVYSYIGNGEVIFVLLLTRVGGFLTVNSGVVVSDE